MPVECNSGVDSPEGPNEGSLNFYDDNFNPEFRGFRPDEVDACAVLAFPSKSMPLEVPPNLVVLTKMIDMPSSPAGVQFAHVGTTLRGALIPPCVPIMCRAFKRNTSEKVKRDVNTKFREHIAVKMGAFNLTGTSIAFDRVTIDKRGNIKLIATKLPARFREERANFAAATNEEEEYLEEYKPYDTASLLISKIARVKDRTKFAENREIIVATVAILNAMLQRKNIPFDIESLSVGNPGRLVFGRSQGYKLGE